ncbi:MAG: hypothetical protein Ct9H300mP28_31930 [Pseudomonadota bacterium]|nr:MAG: hypothetical protein Ct9H300mP28_31930 [Pseudomonadota bacterium]
MHGVIARVVENFARADNHHHHLATINPSSGSPYSLSPRTAQPMWRDEPDLMGSSSEGRLQQGKNPNFFFFPEIRLARFFPRELTLCLILFAFESFPIGR